MMVLDAPKWPVRAVASSLLPATSPSTFERTHGSARSRVDFVTNRLDAKITVLPMRMQSTCIDAISVSPATTALRAMQIHRMPLSTSKRSTTSPQTTLLITNSATLPALPPLSHHSPPPLRNNHRNDNVHALQHHPHNQPPNQLNPMNSERMELKSCLYRFKITYSITSYFF